MSEATETKLVNSVALTLIARFAIVFATGVGLPGAFLMMNRALSSADAISAKIDALREQSIETAGTVKLIQQTQASQARTVEDHETRLRAAETQLSRGARPN